MVRFLAFAIMTAWLQGSPSGVWLETLQTPARSSLDFTKLGMAVFDITVDARGVIAHHTPVFGQPPFIEPARVAFDEWQFRQGLRHDVHVNATFLFKPQLELPDSASVLSIPPPAALDRLASPFPLTVVVPGYPMNGMSGGPVTMQAGILPDGTVRDIRVLREATALTAAAVAALRAWRFFVPPQLDADSRTAVVTIYFQAPRLNTAAPNPASTPPPPAVLESATSVTVPVGRTGNLEVGDPIGLNFVDADSNWVLPYASISAIKYIAGPAQSRLMITFSGARNEDTVTFTLAGGDALSTASILSARTGKPIEFGLQL
jgi:TonB family protein